MKPGVAGAPLPGISINILSESGKELENARVIIHH